MKAYLAEASLTHTPSVWTDSGLILWFLISPDRKIYMHRCTGVNSETNNVVEITVNRITHNIIELTEE
jgi:hypothetical protein